MGRDFRDDVIYQTILRYSTALQERYGKEAVRPSAVSEGQGDPPGDVCPAPPAPVPLAEVELKWEMEREEKKLLWEQLQGLEVNLDLLGLGCWETADALPVTCGPMEMSVTSPSQGLKGGGTGKIRGLPPSLLLTTRPLSPTTTTCRAQSKPKPPDYRRNLLRWGLPLPPGFLLTAEEQRSIVSPQSFNLIMCETEARTAQSYFHSGIG